MIGLFLFLLLLLLMLWSGVGTLIFWWGTRNPKPGARRLVRTCLRRVAFRQEQVAVRLWPSAHDLTMTIEHPIPHRVVLVLDRSSSMGRGPGSALSDAKKAAISFLRNTASEHCHVGVVQFDSEAETVQPIGAARDSAILAIRNITGGGATDIALALRQARQALGELNHLPEGCRRTVVLLSDGGSAHPPAHEEARLLKDDEVRLVTIGLGRYTHPVLLRRLASREEDYFHTLRSQDLVRLYGVIGSTLNETGGYGAEIEETVNTEAFMLSSTGEVRPHSLDFNSGLIRWFLPFVGREPEKIPYQIIPLRCGWHRIASQAATLKMADRDRHSQKGESNVSPRLLVLPRFGWPLSFLILNPLWWMLFGSRQEKLVPLKPSPEPVSLPLPEAEPVQAPATRQRADDIPATLVVALGYTGSLVLRALHYHLERLSPRPGGQLEGLWVDTGSKAVDADRGTETLGPEIEERDRILMPNDVRGFFERRQGTTPSPRLSWLDVERELETLRPGDFDLRRGTHGRRILGRAAFYQHLEEDPSALKQALDQRLRSLGQDCRVVVIAGTGGGTGGGMLLDLLIFLKKRTQVLEHRVQAVDALLLSHRVLGGPEAIDKVLLRNGRALAAELGRLSVRGHQKLRMPQTPDEDGEPREVSRFLDGVLLLEHVLEHKTMASSWPAPAAHAAAQVLLQLLLDPVEGTGGYLVGHRRLLRESQRKSGQAMIYGASSSSRWLPIHEAGKYLVAKTVLDFLSRDLLLLERRAGRLAYGAGDELRQIGRQQVACLLRRAGLTRSLPAHFPSLEGLADRNTAGAELAKILSELVAFPGTAEVSVDVASEELMAAVIGGQQKILDAVLEEWVLRILNVPSEDGSFDPAKRRGTLPQLFAAIEQLEALAGRAVDLLRDMEQSAKREHSASRYELVYYLFLGYHQSIGALKRHLDAWRRVLAPGSDAAAEQAAGESLIELVEALAGSAQDRLDHLRRELDPLVVWSPDIEQQLVSKYVDPIRDRLLEQVMWITAATAGPPELVLRIQGAVDTALRDAPRGEELWPPLEQIVLDLGLSTLDREHLSDFLDLRSWLTAQREDPVLFDENRHRLCMSEPAERQEFALLPSDVMKGGKIESGGALHVAEGFDLHRASLVRFLSPCALEATGPVADYERRISEEAHARLPFLDPVDRRAADTEDALPRFGMTRSFLSAAMRTYFREPKSLRAVMLGAALGILSKKHAVSDRVLWLGDHQLTEEPREAGYPMLLDALDGLLMGGSGMLAIDRRRVIDDVDGVLAQEAEGSLRQRIQGLEEAIASVVDDCPPAVRTDVLVLAKLFLEIELERRSRKQGGIP